MVSATRARPTAESQRELEALIVYLRQECVRASASIAEYAGPDSNDHPKGMSAYYRDIANALDTLLRRIACAWDIERLRHAHYLVSTAMRVLDGQCLYGTSIDEAQKRYESNITSTGRDRACDTRYDRVDGAQRATAVGPADRLECSDASDKGDESDRPGRPETDAADSRGAEGGDVGSTWHPYRTNTGDTGRDTH